MSSYKDVTLFFNLSGLEAIHCAFLSLRVAPRKIWKGCHQKETTFPCAKRIDVVGLYPTIPSQLEVSFLKGKLA